MERFDCGKRTTPRSHSYRVVGAGGAQRQDDDARPEWTPCPTPPWSIVCCCHHHHHHYYFHHLHACETRRDETSTHGTRGTALCLACYTRLVRRRLASRCRQRCDWLPVRKPPPPRPERPRSQRGMASLYAVCVRECCRCQPRCPRTSPPASIPSLSGTTAWWMPRP